MLKVAQMDDIDVIDEMEAKKENRKNFKSAINKQKLSDFELDELFLDL